jgi:diguanylate cyclase (GGDEF)-like protein
MLLSVLLYTISLLAQLTAAIYATSLFYRAKPYRLTCGFLALGLTLMLGRRIDPLIKLYEYGQPNVLDAFLSAPISIFLLIGIFQFRRLLIDLELKNFTLSQIYKIDSLTGILSRPEAFARSQIEIERSHRSKKEVAFLMIDIDHFKLVNDTYGHPVGDIVLTNLAKRCKESLRAIDIFGRMGGDEFLIVLPETTKSQALEVAERLRQSVESASCAQVGNNDIFITISIGIAIFDPHKEEIDSSQLILKKYCDLCDCAMYRAKNSGRNRIAL